MAGVWRVLRRLVVLLLLVALIAPPASVLLYRFVPPPITMPLSVVTGLGARPKVSSCGSEMARDL